MKDTLHLAAALLLCAMLPCACNNSTWTKEEKGLIDGNGCMRVLTLEDRTDSLLLRQPCLDFTEGDLRDECYSILAERMVATVTDPSQDGVGIAGPQVGLLRRIVAVQRFDKEGEPFEVYPNIRITALRGPQELGREGCLSVPAAFVPQEGALPADDVSGTSTDPEVEPSSYGMVMRYRDIDIAYTSPLTLCDTAETVTGFTAVIFQHECDHLDGILFIDRL